MSLVRHTVRALYAKILGMSQVWESVKAVRGKTPKTVLGFLWGVGALAIAGFMGFSWACAANPALVPLLPWVGFACLLLLGGVLAVVVTAMFKDPSRLLLTTVEPADYVQIQRMRLGDSTSGERMVGSIIEREELAVVADAPTLQIEESAGEESQR